MSWDIGAGQGGGWDIGAGQSSTKPTITVDTDGVSGDYSNLSGAVGAIPSVLDNDYRIICSASTGVADAGAIIVKDANGYSITIEAAPGQEAVKSGLDTSRYRCSGITGTTDNVTFSGLQMVTAGNGFQYAAENVVIENCRILATGTNDLGILVQSSPSSIEVYNSIFEGPFYDGIQVNFGDLKIYNSIIYGVVSDGMEWNNTATGTVVNCSVQSGSDDFDIAAGAVVTIDHTMSDDGDGTNPQGPSGGLWTNEYTDPANGDYTALETGNLPNGIGPASDPNVPTEDIEGDPRSGTTTYIGVDEPVGGGQVSIPSIQNSYRLRRSS